MPRETRGQGAPSCPPCVASTSLVSLPGAGSDSEPLVVSRLVDGSGSPARASFVVDVDRSQQVAREVSLKESVERIGGGVVRTRGPFGGRRDQRFRLYQACLGKNVHGAGILGRGRGQFRKPTRTVDRQLEGRPFRRVRKGLCCGWIVQVLSQLHEVRLQILQFRSPGPVRDSRARRSCSAKTPSGFSSVAV